MDKKKLKNEFWQMMPKHLLGRRKTDKNCLEFITNDIIIYPCGIYMVFNNILSNSKSFIPLEKSENISSLFVFIEKKIIILEEKLAIDNRVNLHFLDIQSGARIKSISIQNCSLIIDLKFSFDGNRFLLQNDEQALSFWSFDKSRMICSTNIVDIKIKPSHKVKEISFHPNNKNKVVVIGTFIFKCYLIIDDRFVIDWEIQHTENFTSHTWISNKDIVLGNKKNNIKQTYLFTRINIY
jgi:WD40 repeat protein